MSFRYNKVRIVCNGKIKGCEHCKDIEFEEGYCKLCERPLWKKIGDPCNVIIGYRDGDLKKQGKIDLICRSCRTVITL